MGVDGFRFDLASTLTRDADGHPAVDPPLLGRIAGDPALAHCKLVAEPWDMGLYHVGRFPHHGRFAELNGRFRDDVRDWLRRASPGPERLATRLAGSPDLYAPDRPPGHSVNFLTSHDGFTLADLVSHERKHNESNGERNRDGTNDHRSWNGGAEGPTHDPRVRAVRARQVRNAALLMLLSRGALLWLWGDESLRSQRGDNNAWCHDGPAWWLDWEPPPHARAFERFVRGLLELRARHPALVAGAPPTWTGPGLEAPGHAPRGLRAALRWSSGTGRDLLLLVNGERGRARFEIARPPDGRAWHPLADSAATPPLDWTPIEGSSPLAPDAALVLPDHAAVLLASR